jgi:hypothetical protein
MKKLSRIVTLALAGATLAAPAGASTLYTSMADSPYQLVKGEAMFCTVVNARPTPVKVTVRTKDAVANVVDDSGPVTLAADQGYTLLATGNSTYCTFDVDGSSKNVVAQAIYARNDNDQYTVAVPAQ